MKKYLIFAVSFILAFSLLQVLFQILSGTLLTFMYTPDIEEAWNTSADSSQATIIGTGQSSFLLTLFIAFLSASIAYFISEKVASIKRRAE